MCYAVELRSPTPPHHPNVQGIAWWWRMRQHETSCNQYTRRINEAGPPWIGHGLGSQVGIRHSRATRDGFFYGPEVGATSIPFFSTVLLQYNTDDTKLE